MIENKEAVKVLEEMDKFESTFDSKFAVDKETGNFLYGFVIEKQPHRILELGTWRGASAIYLAAGLHKLGRGELITVDVGNDRVELASQNFKKSGVGNYITQVIDDINHYLPNDKTLYDLVFMDARKDEQGKWLKKILANNLVSGGAIIVDDAIKMGDKMSDLFALVENDQRLRGEMKNIDDGLFVIEVL